LRKGKGEQQRTRKGKDEGIEGGGKKRKWERMEETGRICIF